MTVPHPFPSYDSLQTTILYSKSLRDGALITTLISKLQTVEAHFNCSSLLSSANYVPAISTHINVHSFAHSFWAVKLYNLQVMCHTR
jgi:hypothetical protein